MDLSPIYEAEVVDAAKKMKWHKASGKDRVPAEFWKAICQHDALACKWAVALCQKCWEEGSVPTAWHGALVTAIFKKGDVSKRENYRPICLLQVGYKLFASVLLGRLKAAGAEERMWNTQFWFRTKHGTSDAVFLARRHLDDVWDAKDGKLVLLALDWAKAFDSISPDAMMSALMRFGLPRKFVETVQAIYSGRTFTVRDAGQTSCSYEQCFGICQGCPLSPFLFSMVMTVLIRDARELLGISAPSLRELVYADDTLIVASCAEDAEAYMRAVAVAGANYGLQYNWKKLEALPVRCEACIPKPDGTDIAQKDSIV